MTLHSCDWCGWIGADNDREPLGETDPEDGMYECPECGEPTPTSATIVEIRKASHNELVGLRIQLREQGGDPKTINHTGKIKSKDGQILTLTDLGHEWEVDLRERWEMV